MAGAVPLPPDEYRGDTVVQVYFTRDVKEACVELGDPGMLTRVLLDTKVLNAVECYIPTKDTMVMPDPCRWPDPMDGYAKVACHSMGHANGWVHGPDGGWIVADGGGD